MTNHRAYYFEDVATHSSKGDCWVIISGKVYNVSTFLDDHPGGDEVLLAATGKDATVDFDDVGHSDEAKDLMRKYCIGEADKSTLPLPVRHTDGSAATEFDAGKNHSSTGGLAKMLQLLIPLFILAAALALRQYKNRHLNDNK